MDPSHITCDVHRLVMCLSINEITDIGSTLIRIHSLNEEHGTTRHVLPRRMDGLLTQSDVNAILNETNKHDASNV